MSFLSTSFVFLVLVTIVIFFVLPKKYRWIILLIASYVFYISKGLGIALFLVTTTLTTFFSAIFLEKLNSKQKITSKKYLDVDKRNAYRKKIKKLKMSTLLGILLINFGILFLLKYYNYFTTSFFLLVDSVPANEMFQINILLPLGISFYTFQSIGYVIDVSRSKIKADKNLAKFALFVSFFPQIIQGPIGRYDLLTKKLYAGQEFDYERLKRGLLLVSWGLFKVLVIAKKVAVPIDMIFGDYVNYPGVVVLASASLYCIQIYSNFSGGIDIATGISEIFGIKLSDNFKRPYFARNISEFWQRWHITLGSWMRDYVFYPLCLTKSFIRLGRNVKKWGGNYVGKVTPSILATLIIFVLIGIWHGPNWKFLAYGIYNGVIIAVSLLLKPIFEKTTNKFDTTSLLWRLFQIFRTFLLVSFGRFFSRAGDLRTALSMIKRTILHFDIFKIFDGIYRSKVAVVFGDFNTNLILFGSIFILFSVEFYQERGVKIRDWVLSRKVALRWLIYFLLIFTLILFTNSKNGIGDFIYEKF